MNSLPTSPACAQQTLARQWVSALADGQRDAVEPACAHLAKDADARQAWHEYQLIGDVLRSEDLAQSPAREHAFLLKLRERLDKEPVIVAPLPLPEKQLTAPSSRRWAVAAAAAGFMLVGGVVWLLQGLDSSDARLASVSGSAGASVAQVSRVSGELALAGSNPAVGPAVAMAPRSTASAALGDPQWRVLDGKMIRDERLDAYLRAHRGLAAARPGGGAGRFETVVLER